MQITERKKQERKRTLQMWLLMMRSHWQVVNEMLLYFDDSALPKIFLWLDHFNNSAPCCLHSSYVRLLSSDVP